MVWLPRGCLIPEVVVRVAYREIRLKRGFYGLGKPLVATVALYEDAG
jgi:hypothetical protein